MKKIKSANGEDGGQGTGDATSGKGTGIEEDDDDDTDSESKSVASGESDSNDGQHSGSQDDSKIKRKGDTDGISSITTKQTKAERNLYILRIAIDEKFIPQSIKNLRYAANIVFMILLLLASKISTYRLFIVIYYAIQISLFDLINQNIKNIHNSEQRLSYIIDITLRSRTLILMNNDYLTSVVSNQTARDILYNTTINELRSSATLLKVAQTELSLKTSTLSEEQLQMINPSDVKMKYLKYPNMPDFYTFSVWEAIMEIVVSAYRVSTLPLKMITDSHATVFFIMQNCLNSVM